MLLSNLVIGQDTIYVYQKVGGILKIPVNNVDSIIFYDTTSIAVDASITDADGNVYTSVTIGTQEWMVENLRTTKYSDGTSIPNVTDGDEWSDIETAAWCNYDNSSTNDATYGKLYNWYAVETGKLCPTGWHVPTDDYGFLGLPGGNRVTNGDFDDIGSLGYWWSSSQVSTNNAWYRDLTNNDDSVNRSYSYKD